MEIVQVVISLESLPLRVTKIRVNTGVARVHAELKNVARWKETRKLWHHRSTHQPHFCKCCAIQVALHIFPFNPVTIFEKNSAALEVGDDE